MSHLYNQYVVTHPNPPLYILHIPLKSMRTYLLNALLPNEAYFS